MKKVRFQVSDNFSNNKMNESECHSPRPFIKPQTCANLPMLGNVTRLVPFSTDPIQRFECSNSSPYPIATRTSLPAFSQQAVRKLPSDDLDLSMLDTSTPGTRQSRPLCKNVTRNFNFNTPFYNSQVNVLENRLPQVLTPIENTKNPPNVLTKDNDFFIRKENIHKLNYDSYPLHQKLNCLNLGKENSTTHINKVDLLKNISTDNVTHSKHYENSAPVQPLAKKNTATCKCHHCERFVHDTHSITPHIFNSPRQEPTCIPCVCAFPQSIKAVCHNCHHQLVEQTCSCNPHFETPKLNVVNKKNWAIERYEQNKKPEYMEVEKQTNVSKEKREPTVADLFKIIKLQNEQLQMLQEKVDKFISTSTQGTKELSERIVERVTNEEHKISIGVMTSFEMVRTSTVINKEKVTQVKENSQLQCNKSHISVKEVADKAKPVNLNFLDGIAPVAQPVQATQNCVENQLNDDKTLNEYSLYNVQVDNATTPMISPEHSMYLDVRDYSDSDASSDDQSNVGWTYYNKVMTQVNGMLQDSDMPSSASAFYRNARQQCVQMQIDKTNVSVTKRVKFGDDPLGVRQPHIYAPSSDTSLKMNQLAVKYLKQTQPQLIQRQLSKQVLGPADVSIGTKNYMERHRIIQAGPSARKSPPLNELPNFLDRI